MTPDAFRRYGHQLIDWLADHQAGVAARPVQAVTEPGAVAAALPAAPPERGEPFGDVLADLDRIVVPGLSLFQHPRFFGYFPANAEPAGILGDLASTGLGVLGLSWQSSPALTEVEDVTTGWMRQMVGLSEAWRGVIQDTASTSTLVALISRARTGTTGYALTRGGHAGGGASRLPSTSRRRVTRRWTRRRCWRGSGGTMSGWCRVTPSLRHAAGRVRGDAGGGLATAGLTPCAVVATTGTTATTAIDPVRGLAARSPGGTASGCTWTRPWPAAR